MPSAPQREARAAPLLRSRLILSLCILCGKRIDGLRLTYPLRRRFGRICRGRIRPLHTADGNRRQHDILNILYGHKAPLRVS